ncbi:GIY-YIG nuclease family protein [Paraburkholderia sp. J11-2]|uniref:GIY-YIG nuclease family protein n=1 Tax=Paraburkholderia sp. J11-2 TaxID=2805431 RepID=UPI002AB729AC|nr:GIY-YIG nuclease family protein [Paraburkholderia sp. J11-2]
MSYGFVYIMESSACPGMFKVGYTTKSPMGRADELTKSTAAPLPLTVICYAEFENVETHEKRIHAELASQRVNERREFFWGPFSRIYHAVMNRDYAIALCEHHAAVAFWDEEHAEQKVIGGFEQ